MSMNQEIKARWVAWLRANADKQSVGRLNRVTSDDEPNHPVGFCCLGGLCEIAVQDGVIEARTKELSAHRYSTDYGQLVEYGKFDELSVENYDPSDTVLPKSVREWAGLTDSDPTVTITDENGKVRTTEHGDVTTLTHLNDELRYNFNQIADIIEAQL